MVQSFGLALTSKDGDIIEWLNMLERSNQKPRRWIQAILIAKEFGLELDAGSVAPAENLGPSDIYSWTLRDDGKYVPGSVLNISISRPIIRYIIEDLKKRGIKVSPFIKQSIRERIHIGANHPPDENAADDVLEFYSWRPLSRSLFTQFPAKETYRVPQRKRVEAGERTETAELRTNQEIPGRAAEEMAENLADINKAEEKLAERTAEEMKPERKRNPILDYIGRHGQ